MVLFRRFFKGYLLKLLNPENYQTSKKNFSEKNKVNHQNFSKKYKNLIFMMNIIKMSDKKKE